MHFMRGKAGQVFDCGAGGSTQQSLYAKAGGKRGKREQKCQGKVYFIVV